VESIPDLFGYFDKYSLFNFQTINFHLLSINETFQSSTSERNFNLFADLFEGVAIFPVVPLAFATSYIMA
jgi:hypothetical protein